jgi:hypothetical protein
MLTLLKILYTKIKNNYNKNGFNTFNPKKKRKNVETISPKTETVKQYSGDPSERI